jgi:CRP-like cAMP-binding protein
VAHAVIGIGVLEPLHRLTRTMDAESAAAVRAACVTVRVADGDTVVRDGQPNDALYVVSEGRFAVAVRIGDRDVMLGEKGPGDTFGELSLLTGAAAVADVRASGAGVLLRIDRPALDALTARCPPAELALVRALSEDLAQRVRVATTTLRESGRKRALVKSVFARLIGGGR